jgi:hypothetical protein
MISDIRQLKQTAIHILPVKFINEALIVEK